MSEGMTLEGEDLFEFLIDVAIERAAETEISLLFRLQESSSSAVVDASNNIRNIRFDAIFGQRVNPDDPLEEYYNVNEGDDMSESLPTMIRNDFRPKTE